MTTKCLKCARYQQLKGYRVCREGYDVLWGILLQNFSAELELTTEQTSKLVRISDEMRRVLLGAEEMSLSPDEYVQYITGKAEECTDRLRHLWE